MGSCIASLLHLLSRIITAFFLTILTYKRIIQGAQRMLRAPSAWSRLAANGRAHFLFETEKPAIFLAGFATCSPRAKRPPCSPQFIASRERYPLVDLSTMLNQLAAEKIRLLVDKRSTNRRSSGTILLSHILRFYTSSLLGIFIYLISPI